MTHILTTLVILLGFVGAAVAEACDAVVGAAVREGAVVIPVTSADWGFVDLTLYGPGGELLWEGSGEGLGDRAGLPDIPEDFTSAAVTAVEAGQFYYLAIPEMEGWKAYYAFHVRGDTCAFSFFWNNTFQKEDLPAAVQQLLD